MPKSATDFLASRPRYIVVVIGPPKSGKSDLLMTFPGMYPLTCDPLGLEFLKTTDRGRELGSNLATHPVELSMSDPSKVFDETKGDFDPDAITSIWQWVRHARQLAKEGKIQSVGLDGASYLSIMLRAWQESRPENHTNEGELNTFRMWGSIKLWWNRFLLTELMPLASRYGLNVVLTCHVQREGEDVVAGGSFMGRKTKAKVQTDSDLAPAIEGSFRDLLAGLGGANIYLDHSHGIVSKPGEPARLGVLRTAYCDKTLGMGTTVQAGNRYGLPPKINLTNRSFYRLLLKHSGQQIESKEKEKGES